MNKITTAAVAALLVSSMSFAADVEDKSKKEVDHSKNPITGTETTTTTHETKMKDGAGNMKKMKAEKKVKTHKDGKVETSTEVKTDGEHK